MPTSRRRGRTVAWGVGLRGECLIAFYAEPAAAVEGLGGEAIVLRTAGKGRDGGFAWLRGCGGLEGVDELDVEGFDGAQGTGVGLPVEVA